MVMCLKGAEARGLPAQYQMKSIPGPGGAEKVILFKAPAREGEEPSQMKLDGIIVQSFNLTPTVTIDENVRAACEHGQEEWLFDLPELVA